MDPLLGLGILTAITSAIGGFMDQDSRNKQAKMNYMLEKERLDWDKDRWQNAVTTRVADMKRAGLSPVLAVGSPSAGPTINTGAPQMRKQFNMSGILQRSMQALSTGTQMQQADAQSRLLNAQATKAEKESEFIEAEKRIKLASARLDYDYQQRTLESSIAKVIDERLITRHKLMSSGAQATIDELYKQWASKGFGSNNNYFKLKTAELNEKQKKAVYQDIINQAVEVRLKGERLDAKWFEKLGFGPVIANQLTKVVNNVAGKVIR